MKSSDNLLHRYTQMDLVQSKITVALNYACVLFMSHKMLFIYSCCSNNIKINFADKLKKCYVNLASPKI